MSIINKKQCCECTKKLYQKELKDLVIKMDNGDKESFTRFNYIIQNSDLHEYDEKYLNNDNLEKVLNNLITSNQELKQELKKKKQELKIALKKKQES